MQDHVNAKVSYVIRNICSGFWKVGLTQGSHTAKLRSELGGEKASPYALTILHLESLLSCFGGTDPNTADTQRCQALWTKLWKHVSNFEKTSLQTVDHVHDLQGFETKLVRLQGNDASPDCNRFGAQKAREGSSPMIHHCQCSASGGQTLPSTLPEWAHCFQFLLLIICWALWRPPNHPGSGEHAYCSMTPRQTYS